MPIWRAGGTQAENYTKYGQTGLCMTGAISKRAWLFISILVILASSKITWAIFTNEVLGNFFVCQYKLAIVVINEMYYVKICVNCYLKQRIHICTFCTFLLHYSYLHKKIFFWHFCNFKSLFAVYGWRYTSTS